MQLSTVEVWNSECGFSVPNILFHSRDEREIRRIFSELATTGAINLRHTFYKVLPNGQDYIELIKAYVARKKGIYGGALETPRLDQHIEPLDELCHALRIFSSTYSASANDKINRLLYLPDAQASLEVIRRICFDLLPKLESQSPFIFQKLEEPNKIWWSKPPALKGQVQNLKSTLAQFFGKSIPPQLNTLYQWLLDLDTNLDLLAVNQRLGRTVGDAVMQASSYCAALAERKLLLGNFTLAVLLIHRSADLLLFSLCIQENLIDFTKNSGAGAYNFDSKQITLIDSLSALTARISPNSGRDRLFSELNKWRNQLIYTHYLSGVNSEQAGELLIKLRPEMEKLGGTSWTRAREIFLTPPLLDSMQILNTNNCMESIFEEVDFY